MFSLKTGEKIAKIKGGNLDGKFIYLHNNENKLKELSKEFYGKYKTLEKKDLAILRKALRTDKEPNDPKIKKIYNDAVNDINKSLKNRIAISGGKLEPVPTNRCEKAYCSGVSGSGKSTYTSKYIKNYKDKYPDNPIIIFSSLKEDKAFDKYDVQRIPIDETLISEPLNLEEFHDSLTIFDDTDTIKDKALLKEVNDFKAHMIECGRHFNARCIITSHIISNYRDTRQILNECTSITFFPLNNLYHIKNYLKNYMGLDKDQIERIVKIPSRWVTIYCHYPQYIMWENGICLLKEF